MSIDWFDKTDTSYWSRGGMSVKFYPTAKTARLTKALRDRLGERFRWGLNGRVLYLAPTDNPDGYRTRPTVGAVPIITAMQKRLGYVPDKVKLDWDDENQWAYGEVSEQ